MLSIFKSYIIGIGIIFIIILGCSNALAEPLYPFPMEVTQPNGTTITVRTYGDEFFSWKEDENGNIVAYDNETESYKYAKIEDGKIVATSQTVGEISLSNAFPQRIKHEDIKSLWENAERVDYSKNYNGIELVSADNRTANAQAPLIHQKLLVILIEFNDISIEFGSEYWHDSMFSTNPNDLSVVNYYKENSGGLDVFEPANTAGVQDGRKGTASYKDYNNVNYTITKCPEGVVKVSLDMPHPVKTWANRDDTETEKTVNLAIQAIEQDFNFQSEQPYIVAMFSGYQITVGAGDGKGQIGAYTSVGGTETTDGINLGRHVVVGEKLRETEPIGIGTICHELGHAVFGLPDLYAKDFPIGETGSIALYSLMSLGSLGCRCDLTMANPIYDTPYEEIIGHVPAHLDAWSKIKLGYVTPIVVTSDWDGDIYSISELGADSAYNVLEVRSKADPNQYFLVENRQLIGYDKGLEKLNDMFIGNSFFDGGIVIYHIDENVTPNNNNDSLEHQFIHVEQSDKSGASAWQYVNLNGRNMFNTKTEPNSNFHEFAGLGSCSPSQDCHPQTVKSGISISVFGENGSSINIAAKVDDKYAIIQPNKKFSDAFPDENFCKAVIDLLEKEDVLLRKSDSIISEKDWIKISSTDIIDLENRGIKSLAGIENFISLTNLVICGNELTELTLSDCPKLYLINCEDNQLNNIDISRCENLEYFYCSNNKLTELDLSSNKSLREIYCENNLLTKLDTASNKYLNTLCCSNNKLKNLDFSNNLNLWVLRCYDNYMDNEPYQAIKGLSAVASELGEPTSKDNEGKGWFVYFPQSVLPTTPFTVKCDMYSTTVTNNSDETVTVAVIIAKYDSNGVLQTVTSDNSDFTANGTKHYDTDSNTKIFVWNSLSGMRPLTAKE